MLTNNRRRLFLKGTLATGLSGMAVATGLLTSTQVFAAWPASAFDTKNVPDTLNALFGHANLTENAEDISLIAPDLAENGAVVPVTLSSRLEGVESIVLLVDKNPNALIARFNLSKNTLPYIKTNIKMAETSQLVAVLKIGDKLYSTHKKIKVTLNGCGN